LLYHRINTALDTTKPKDPVLTTPTKSIPVSDPNRGRTSGPGILDSSQPFGSSVNRMNTGPIPPPGPQPQPFTPPKPSIMPLPRYTSTGRGLDFPQRGVETSQGIFRGGEPVKVAPAELPRSSPILPQPRFGPQLTGPLPISHGVLPVIAPGGPAPAPRKTKPEPVAPPPTSTLPRKIQQEEQIQEVDPQALIQKFLNLTNFMKENSGVTIEENRIKDLQIKIEKDQLNPACLVVLNDFFSGLETSDLQKIDSSYTKLNSDFYAKIGTTAMVGLKNIKQHFQKR